MRRRLLLLMAATLCMAVTGGAWQAPATRVSSALPARLTDATFWRLIDEFSEPDGFFRSDNLVSNEDTYQLVIPELKRRIKPGAAYLGVGPDQNFTYIVALRPGIAFITDVRRGNLHVHLMYKALFELSADRAEFLSRLFSRARPSGPGTETTDHLFADILHAPRDRVLYDANERALIEHLLKRRQLPLLAEDVAGIRSVYFAFFMGGPGLAYSSGPSTSRTRYPTYADLQLATDGQGVSHGYLATEANFRAVKAMQERNLVVPLVGNFAGARALRSVGTYLKSHGVTVGALYASNVEQYLFQDGLWRVFMRTVAALPQNESSTFIRSCFNSCASPAGTRAVQLVDSMPGLLRDLEKGRILSYADVLNHSRER